MQTFMPYPSMRESVDVLDQARLGKQRVETLQLLRSALLPSYGWQRHPVSVMWRGYLPGLVAYGLRSVDAWTERGHADSTRPLIREFAPEVDGLSQAELTDRGLLPDWIGDETVHRSHRSNLIAKAPEFYRPLFPGTPEDLDYHWPSGGEAPTASGRPRLQVVRAADAAELHAWTEAGLVRIGAVSPRGSAGPAWQAQLKEFVDGAAVGDRIGVVEGAGAVIRLTTVLGEAVAVSGPGMIADASGGDALIRRVRFEDALERSALPVPAELQNPRHCFTVELPAS